MNIRSNEPLRPLTVPPAVHRLLPEPIKAALKRTICAVVDVIEALLGRRDALTPPCHLRVRVGCFLSFINAVTYRAVALESLEYILGGLKIGSTSRVLDVGCGCGQTASQLAQHIGAGGVYEGFDTDAEAIAWCRQYISALYPWFRFEVADVENGYYNPGGAMTAAGYRFPYADASFDAVILKSVFTHMRPEDLQGYLAEIARVLAPGGRCLITYYLIDDQARQAIDAGKSAFEFRPTPEGYYAIEGHSPEYAIAFDESAITEFYVSHGLQIDGPVLYGAWSGRSRYSSYQDIVVARRLATPPHNAD